MKRLLLALSFLIVGASFAYAQSPVITQPYQSTISQSSLTIGVTNTFQSLWAANTAGIGRVDCIIQNNGAASMYIYFGPIANATTPNSLILTSGSIFKCANSGVMSKDQISVTGTAGQRLFAITY